MEKRNRFRHTFPCATAAGATPAFAQSSVTLYGDRRQCDRLPKQPNVARLNDRRQVRSEDEGQRLGGQPLRAEGQRRSRWQHEGDFPARVGLQLCYGCCPIQRRAVRSQAWVGVTNPAYGTLTTGPRYTSCYQTLSPDSPTTWLTGFWLLWAAPWQHRRAQPRQSGKQHDRIHVAGDQRLNGERLVLARRRRRQRDRRRDIGGDHSIRGGAARLRGRVLADQQLEGSGRHVGLQLDNLQQRRADRRVGAENGYQTARAAALRGRFTATRALRGPPRPATARSILSSTFRSTARCRTAPDSARSRRTSARGARRSAPFQHDAVLVGLPVRVRDGDYSPVLTPRRALPSDGGGPQADVATSALLACSANISLRLEVDERAKSESPSGGRLGWTRDGGSAHTGPILALKTAARMSIHYDAVRDPPGVDPKEEVRCKFLQDDDFAKSSAH